MMMNEFPGGWPFQPATRSPSWLNPRGSPRGNMYMNPQYDSYYYPSHRSFNGHFSPFDWEPLYADDLPVIRKKPKSPATQPPKRRTLQNKKPNVSIPTSIEQSKPENIIMPTAMESDQLNVTPSPVTSEVVKPNSSSDVNESMSSENNEELTDSVNDDEQDSNYDDGNCASTASEHSSGDEQDHGLSKQDIEDRLAVVEGVKQKAEQLKEQVNSFAKQKGSKEFIFLDESLLSLLLELDKVETMGCTDIRQARKTTVLMIQELHSILESRAVNNVD